MTVQEKLDDLDGRLQQLSHIINESAGRGNREFTDIDRRLSVIEEMLKTLGTAAEKKFSGVKAAEHFAAGPFWVNQAARLNRLKICEQPQDRLARKLAVPRKPQRHSR